MLRRGLIILAVSWLAGGIFARPATALMWSDNFRVEADQLNYGGSESLSDNFRNWDALGEWVSGLSISDNFVINAGLPAQVNTTITLSLDSNNKSLGTLTPGTPVEATTVINVTTDAANGYSLAANYNGTMTDGGAHTIPDFSGTIGSPVSWSGNCPTNNECGFGFTVSAGTNVESKWGSGANYAAFTTTATEIHQKTGYTGGGADQTSVRYRSDVTNIQETGLYQTTVTYTVTAAL